jgi:hypothetical protein
VVLHKLNILLANYSVKIKNIGEFFMKRIYEDEIFIENDHIIYRALLIETDY